MNLNETKKEFFFNSLLPKVVSASSPRAINLYDDFRVYIRSIGYGDIRSAEIANRQFAALTDYLERQLSDWDAQGVPRPLTRTDQENVFLAWPHEQFLRYSDWRNLSIEIFVIFPICTNTKWETVSNRVCVVA